MINPKIVITALAAIVGIGGAYATTCTHSDISNETVYNWYTASGQFKMAATTITAGMFGCGMSGKRICLRGTAGRRHVTFFKP